MFSLGYVLLSFKFPELAGPHQRFRLCEESGGTVFSDQIELHVLELPKFDKRLPDLADDLDKWLFFLRHAATLDINHWPLELSASPWQRAGRELTMLAQSDIEREKYEVCRKGQLDYTTDMRAERRIGEGRGEAMATIRLLQRFLKRPATSNEEFGAMSIKELTALETTLTAAARQAGIDL